MPAPSRAVSQAVSANPPPAGRSIVSDPSPAFGLVEHGGLEVGGGRGHGRDEGDHGDEAGDDERARA
jgi:hypothetical protein